MQRATQTSVTEYLSGDAEDLHSPYVEQYKRKTAVDLQASVFLGPNSYHEFLPGGIPGCPNAGWELEEGSIEDAIEEELSPCKGCRPIDYRVTEAHPAAGDETAIALPHQRPTSPADLDPIVHTNGNTQRTAHIAGTGGEDPEPLCVCAGRYNCGENWVCKPQSVYPDPTAWFELCGYCLAVIDERGGDWR